jgi:four helix bundle protein
VAGGVAVAEKIVTHRDLQVYQRAFDAQKQIFQITKRFPKEETYSLTDQIRRSSRSVCANLAEAWRKRRYEGAFIAKLSDSEGEAAETQVWLECAMGCRSITPEQLQTLHECYDSIISTIVGMINHPETWILKHNKEERQSSW